MIEDHVESIVEQYESGSIDRRQFVRRVSAIAVGGASAGFLDGDSVAQDAASDFEKRRLILMSRLANVRLVMDSGKLKIDKSRPMVFSGIEHQAWLFSSDRLFSGKQWKHSAKCVDLPVNSTKHGEHPGLGDDKTKKTPAEPMRWVAKHSKTIGLLEHIGESTPAVSKAFDLKLAATEVEGMFHIGKEVHKWAKGKSDVLAEEVRDVIVAAIYNHYKEYFKGAVKSDVEAEFDKRKTHEPGAADFTSHEW